MNIYTNTVNVALDIAYFSPVLVDRLMPGS